MAPFKSTLAKSVGKLLGVYRNDDLVLNSSVISNRFINPQVSFITGSGGVVSAGISSDGYKYHTFTSPGSFTWTGGDTNSSIEFLIVGGGGAGGWGRVAGGGGAGQVLQSINYAIPFSEPSTISITVGSGGNISADTPTVPGNGNHTTISHPTGIVTALGGGAGGTDLDYSDSPNYVIGQVLNVASHGGNRGNETNPDLTFPSPVWPHYHGFGSSNNVYPYPTVGMTTSNIAAHGSAPSAAGVNQYSGTGGGGAFAAGIQGGANTAEFGIAATAYRLATGMYAKGDDISSAHGGAGGDGIRLYTYRAANILPPSSPLYTGLNEIEGFYGGGGGGGHLSPYPTAENARNPGGRGGGAGSSYNPPNFNGRPGGCGGGAASATGASGGGQGQTAYNSGKPTNYGQPGAGYMNASSPSNNQNGWGASGGGGIGQAGFGPPSPGVSDQRFRGGGNGGDGVQLSISGTATYYGGGGGGSSFSYVTPPDGAGGGFPSGECTYETWIGSCERSCPNNADNQDRSEFCQYYYGDQNEAPKPY